MDGQNQINAQRLLQGVVPDEIFASYSKLLAEDGCSEDDAASLLGGCEQVTELTARGMAHLRPDGPLMPPRLVPAPPELALQGVLTDLSRRLVSDQERLLSGHKRLS